MTGERHFDEIVAARAAQVRADLDGIRHSLHTIHDEPTRIVLRALCNAIEDLTREPPSPR